MKQRVRDLLGVGDRLFTARSPLLSTWQDFAMNFYPERADFTTQRSIGTQYASHLVTGQPVMARRDMANSLSAMLRPRSQPWFHGVTNDEGVNKDPEAKKWLEWTTEIQRKFTYDNRAKFMRATKEADNDFVTFGQAVIQVRENAAHDGVFFRTYHLRDMVWSEGAELDIDCVVRQGKMRGPELEMIFGRETHSGRKGLHPKVAEVMAKDPAYEFKIRHMFMPRDQYDLNDSSDEKKRPGSRLPFVSIYIDVENDHVMEEVGAYEIDYVIPRWQTVSGSQYAHSPAAVIAVPDARMLQQISLTLLQAGQKSVDPPMIAQAEMIQGGINTFAGGVTWVDAEYDERLGEVLRPMTVERGGFTWGDALQTRIENNIKEAFYLNQIAMPDTQGEMTAYEVQKRFEEYIRRALPLFEPMEVEYNGGICDRVFRLLDRNGAFGRPQERPQILQGQEIKFSFASPLQQAQNRANSQAFMESANLLKIAVEMDPSARHILDVQTATRDAMEGAQAPATWFNSREQVDQATQADAQQAQAQQMAQQVSQGAQVAGQAGDAMGKIKDALSTAPDKGQQDMQGGGQGGQQPPQPANVNTPDPLAGLMAQIHGR